MKTFIKNLEYGASIGKTKKWFIWIKIPRMENTTTIFSKLNNYQFTQSDFDIWSECETRMRQLEIYDVNNLYSHKDFIYDSVKSKSFTYWYIKRYEPEIIQYFYKKYKSNVSGRFWYLHRYKTWILNNEFINRDSTEKFLSKIPYITTKWDTIDFFIFNKVREKTLIRILKRFVNENYDAISHTLYNPVNGIMMSSMKNDFDKLSKNAISDKVL